MDTTATRSSGATRLLIVSWAEFSVATTLIALRILTRLQIVKDRGLWALVWALVAWVFGVGNTVSISLSVTHGMGDHGYNLSDTQVTYAIMWSWLADAMSRLSIAFGKVAVIAFILEVQQNTHLRWQRFFLLFVAGTNVLLNVLLLFIILFQCSPARALWDQVVGGHCPRRQTNFYAGSFITAWGATSDVVVAVYPVMIVWNLQMRMWKKLGLVGLMGLGVFAGVCAAVTCYQLHVAVDTDDPTYVLTPLTQWATTEMWVVIIAGSVPPLWPLLSRSTRVLKDMFHTPCDGSGRAMARGALRRGNWAQSGHARAKNSALNVPNRTEFIELRGVAPNAR